MAAVSSAWIPVYFGKPFSSCLASCNWLRNIKNADSALWLAENPSISKGFDGYQEPSVARVLPQVLAAPSGWRERILAACLSLQRNTGCFYFDFNFHFFSGCTWARCQKGQSSKVAIHNVGIDGKNKLTARGRILFSSFQRRGELILSKWIGFQESRECGNSDIQRKTATHILWTLHERQYPKRYIDSHISARRCLKNCYTAVLHW